MPALGGPALRRPAQSPFSCARADSWWMWMWTWVAGDCTEATSAPFTVTVLWAILPTGEKTHRREVWKVSKATRNTEEKQSPCQDPKGSPDVGVKVAETLTAGANPSRPWGLSPKWSDTVRLSLRLDPPEKESELSPSATSYTEVPPEQHGFKLCASAYTRISFNKHCEYNLSSLCFS